MPFLRGFVRYVILDCLESKDTHVTFMGCGFTSGGQESGYVLCAAVCKIKARKHYIKPLPSLVLKDKRGCLSEGERYSWQLPLDHVLTSGSRTLNLQFVNYSQSLWWMCNWILVVSVLVRELVSHPRSFSMARTSIRSWSTCRTSTRNWKTPLSTTSQRTRYALLNTMLMRCLLISSYLVCVQSLQNVHSK